MGRGVGALTMVMMRVGMSRDFWVVLVVIL